MLPNDYDTEKDGPKVNGRKTGWVVSFSGRPSLLSGWLCLAPSDTCFCGSRNTQHLLPGWELTTARWQHRALLTEGSHCPGIAAWCSYTISFSHQRPLQRQHHYHPHFTDGKIGYNWVSEKIGKVHRMTQLVRTRSGVRLV